VQDQASASFEKAVSVVDSKSHSSVAMMGEGVSLRRKEGDY